MMRDAVDHADLLSKISQLRFTERLPYTLGRLYASLSMASIPSTASLYHPLSSTISYRGPHPTLKPHNLLTRSVTWEFWMKLLVIIIFGGLNNDGGNSRRSTHPVHMFKGIALWLWCTLGVGRTYIWHLEVWERLGFVAPCFIQDGFYVPLAMTLTFLVGGVLPMAFGGGWVSDSGPLSLSSIASSITPYKFNSRRKYILRSSDITNYHIYSTLL